MTWSTIGPLVFVWWNTSLSPPISRRKAVAADLEFVIAQLREIRQQTACDVLALGEVCATDLDAILTGLGEPQLAVFDATDRTTKPMFDTAVIYDQSRLSLEDTRSIVDKFGRKTLKTGEVFEFRALETGDLFKLVVSHWPSRLTASESTAQRAELGTALRWSVERMQEDEAASFIVLMGDYNDDPFSPSLASHLLATRDRTLARRDSRFLYNPFWKWIGESHDGVHNAESGGVCGTHFYAGGETSQWFTYDQIIFSSAFLRDQSLVLNEKRSGILAPPALRSKLLKKSEIFDHLPVLATVELRSRT
ncbi:hypothetical protein LMG22931_01901 [Paraburkholderia nemoris]|nr:hypothetical protein LMG22931_01901 [Paraburkholderia nemoris]